VPASDLLRQSLGLNSDAHIALYQGNLTPDRGLERLIRAATFLDQNIVIVIMGRGELEAELKALIMHEGVADRVKVLPPVPYQELLNWTASADAGLMVYAPDRSLNVRMCLPNKLFEYLMAGLPVLSSQLDAVVDILETYDVGQVVSSLTPENVALAINALVTNHAVYARLRRNALQASQQELHWDREKQKLIQMYAELLPLHHMAEMKRPRRKRS
jgi:glycosyltransferase involved in cell wall biosynthesis